MSFNPVIPNHATENEIRAYFIQRGTDALQRTAGYKPQQAFPESQFSILSPLHPNLVKHIDAMMSELCGQAVTNCNARVPYLLTIWIWIGADNPYRLIQYTHERQNLRDLINAFYLIFGVVSEDIMDSMAAIREIKLINAAKNGMGYVQGMIHRGLVRSSNRDESRQAINERKLQEAETTLRKQALKWAHLTDEELVAVCVRLAWTLYEEITTNLSKYWDIPF